MAQEKCATCRFWAGRDKPVTIPMFGVKGGMKVEGDGWCHRYPETVHKGSDQSWCGEFKPAAHT
jgi:hypothetical protein